jgi:glycosyltransferase involved in cell wall biosynthesis
MDKPLISVVIPVLNNAERLKICLEALERPGAES